MGKLKADSFVFVTLFKWYENRLDIDKPMRKEQVIVEVALYQRATKGFALERSQLSQGQLLWPLDR